MTWQSHFRERGSQHRFPALKSQKAVVTSIHSQEVEIGMAHMLGIHSLSPLDTAQDSLPGEFPFQGGGRGGRTPTSMNSIKIVPQSQGQRPISQENSRFCQVDKTNHDILRS